jgi:hypothetical protein
MQVFRVTGDLRLLDEVDQITQVMRAQLADAWLDGTKDGYLNWLWFRDSNNSQHYGADVHRMDELLTHSLVAAFTWAFEHNRDLQSPSGIDYGERADFWYDYLKNHFEAKWRSGSPYWSVPWSEPCFITRYTGHTHTQGIRLYHYMDRLMDKRGERNYDGTSYDGRYGECARRQTDEAFDTPRIENKHTGGIFGHDAVNTPMGKALIWPSGLPYGWSETGHRALATTYVRYVHGAVQDLHLEGVYRWGESGEEGVISRLAVNLAYFIMDTDAIEGVDFPFAKDGVGDQEGWPIPPQTDYRGRVSAGVYAISQFALTLAFSPNEIVHDRIFDLTMQVYHSVERDQDNPRRIFIPAGMFLAQVLN